MTDIPPAEARPQGSAEDGTPRSSRIVLEAAGISKTYGSGETATHAIGDISFTVDESEFVCIVGPSGCGKTTLLRIMAGLMQPTSGEMHALGEKVSGPPDEVALVFQDYSRSLFPWMKVARNVAFPLKRLRLPKEEAQTRVRDALESVGLSGFEDRYPWQLSGGMQQRVAIARALAFRPKILLMDEPFASVDAQTRASLEDLMLSVRHRYDVTVVFVTHDIDESVYLADRVVILSNRPTEVREVLDIDLPRPRDQLATKELHRFAELRGHVYESIMQSTAGTGGAS